MSTKKIIVVGGGTGGTFSANLLALKLKNKVKDGDVSIDLFGDRPEHSFQPDFLDVAFRGEEPSHLMREESSLLRQSVRFHLQPITDINLDEQRISTDGGGAFPYHYLVIATGSHVSAEAIPGLAESSYNFHSDGYKATEIWKALWKFKGGRVVVAIAGVPHKCPASPNEAIFLMDDFLRRRGLRTRSELTFATPYPRAYPAEGISRVVEPLLEARGIDVVPFFNVDSVDPAQRRIYSLEGDALDFDLLVAVPPHRGTKVIQASGIGDMEGWIPTDRHRLNVSGYDNVYALGDATDLPISKTGVVAHLEAKVVVENILADLQGSKSRYEFNGRVNCPFETGGGKATFVIANYTSPPKPIKPTKINFWMKRAFSKIYWSTLSGRWESLFDLYFGRTSTKVELIPPALPPPKLIANAVIGVRSG